MRLIAILALTALASTLVVAHDSCSDLGPAFWCENRDNAKICSAVEYCDEFVWKTQKVEKDDIGSTRSDSCQDCTKFVTSLKTFLSTESLTFTQDLVVELVCKAMGQYRQQCESTAKSYLPTISNFLVSQIDPKTVCKQVQLCQKEEQHHNSEFDEFFSVNWSEMLDKKNFNGAPKICDDCKKFVETAKNLGKQFQPLIKELTVRNVCSRFHGSAKVECEVIANILPPAFGEALKYIDSTKECTAFRLCSRTSDSASNEDSTELPRDKGTNPLENIAMTKWNYPPSAKTCTDCQQFFKALVGFLQKETLTYIQDVILEQLCPRCGPFKQQCADLTKNFLPSTLKMLLGMINPQKTCTAMKCCPRNTPEEQDNNILSDFENQLESIDFEKLAYILQQNLSAPKCEVCKKTITFIQTAIKSFRGPLEAILENVVCNFVGPMRGPCKMIVKALFPSIFDALEHFLKDPTKVCRFFRICASLEAAVDYSFLALDAPQDDLEAKLLWSVVEEPANSVGCLICQRIAQDFENFVKLDETAVCQEFSGQDKSTCVSMVKSFNPALINRLTAAVSPKFFCEKARICPTAKDFGRANRA